LPSVAPQSGPLSFPNGTLLRGSSEKVYVMLNDYRYWIPDSVTLIALGYGADEIRYHPDWLLNSIPEGAPFPSVAR
jgi:hypothetical protein